MIAFVMGIIIPVIGRWGWSLSHSNRQVRNDPLETRACFVLLYPSIKVRCGSSTKCNGFRLRATPNMGMIFSIEAMGTHRCCPLLTVGYIYANWAKTRKMFCEPSTSRGKFGFHSFSVYCYFVIQVHSSGAFLYWGDPWSRVDTPMGECHILRNNYSQVGHVKIINFCITGANEILGRYLIIRTADIGPSDCKRLGSIKVSHLHF